MEEDRVITDNVGSPKEGLSIPRAFPQITDGMLTKFFDQFN